MYIAIWSRHVFCETRMPTGGNKLQIHVKCQNLAKNLKVPHFDPALTSGACDVREVWSSNLKMNLQS